MRVHTYTKFNPQLADAVDLQALLDQLADFLLQSGFAGGEQGHWGADQGEGDRSMDSLKDAILRALIESGQITPEMLARDHSPHERPQDHGQQEQQQQSRLTEADETAETTPC